MYYVNYHLDEDTGETISLKIENEIKQISSTDFSIYLEEIPTKINKVLIDNKELLEIKNKINISDSSFYMDYNMCKIYFSSNYGGKIAHIDYYGIGKNLIGASRVIDELSFNKDVKETLQDIINKGKIYIESLKDFSDAGEVINNLKNDIVVGKQLKNELDIKNSTVSKLNTDLNSTINEGKVLNVNLSALEGTLNNLNNNIKDNTTKATSINSTLATNVSKATEINNKLVTNKDSANTILGNLNTAIANGNIENLKTEVSDMYILVDNIDSKFMGMQNKSDNTLTTNNKTIVGAINELKSDINTMSSTIDMILVKLGIG